MDFSETMFYAESEGLLPTRAGKINAVIKEIKDYPGLSIGLEEFEEILNKYGLKYGELTERELRYIDASIK